MAGLFSSLALSGTLAASVLGSPVPPEAPELPEQQIVQSEYSHSENRDNLSQELVSGSSSYSIDDMQYEGLAGIDISSHQHISGDSQIDLKTTLSSGKIKYGFVKATEGTGYVNPNFRDDYIDFIENDYAVGSYHYARPSSSTEDARKQARVYMSVTGIAQGVKSFDPVLDIEQSDGVGTDDLQDWVEAFIDEIKSKSGRDTIIYTYPSFWRNEMGDTDKFNDMPLWIADYNSQSAPSSLPGNWSNWIFWQYTSQGKVDGYDKNIDLNVFRGSEEDLDKLFYGKKISK